MTYYSHSRKNADGKVEGSKELRVHIHGVTQKALTNLYRRVELGFDAEQLLDLVTVLGKFHDLGKYTIYFQNYLLQKEPIDQILKQHARIGGIAAYHLLKEKDHKLAIIVLYLIFLHHSVLINIEELANKLDSNTKKVFEHQKADITNILSQIADELDLKDFSSALAYPDEKAIRKELKIWTRRNANIRDYFILNYLFSLLIEADKLDASDTSIYNKKSISPQLVDERLGNFDIKIIEQKELKELTQNELRSLVRHRVISRLDEPGILQKRLFTLTAPTGIGKTLTALDFALKLRALIRKVEEREAQIIYALPFINIIEQAINEYKKTLSPEIQILAHYQYADAVEQQKDYDEDRNYHQKVMSLDTWQSDVVITSFVQFLQTLIGNRNKLLKKFNHYAGAIIILDEVQTIRLQIQPLVGAALYYLSKFLDSRIILMTATKPKIFDLTNSTILKSESEEAEPLELLSKYEKVFELFQRTKIVPVLGKEKIESAEAFVDEYLDRYWQKNKSCLIVLNTVNRSIEVFEAIRDYLDKNELNNPIHYLSTNIVPAARLKLIRRVKQNLANNKCPILVSTQSVEAGVDVDFDMGFRDLGPIDSIVQVAGRINRENDLNRKHSPLYIVDFGECAKIYDAITEVQARHALGEQDILEEQYLELVDRYYTALNDKKSLEESRRFFASMKALNYDGEDYSVSEFKVIQEKPAVSVFIELDGAIEAREAFQKLVNRKEKFGKENFEEHKQTFHQHIIAVPDYLEKVEDLTREEKLVDNILWVKNDVVSQYYDTITGFKRKDSETKSTGFF